MTLKFQVKEVRTYFKFSRYELVITINAPKSETSGVVWFSQGKKISMIALHCHSRILVSGCQSVFLETSNSCLA